MTALSIEPNLTCGISNIPLERPAKLSFKVELDKQNVIDQIVKLLEIHNIEYERTDFHYTNKIRLKSLEEVESKILKQIWQNHKTLRPHFITTYRYLFFEIDNKEPANIESILSVYRFLKLPVYCHETMRGYHFLSVRPVEFHVWNMAISQLQGYNPAYPPITLRINPNKYAGEEEYFSKDRIISEHYHSDTHYLRKWIQEKNWVKIGQQYVLVWYSLSNGTDDNKDKWSMDENDL